MSHQSPNKRRQSFDASISKRIREADSEESGLEEYDWEQNIDPDIREHEEEEEEEVYYMYVGDQAHYLTSEDLVEPNCISPNQVKTPVKARKTILEDLNIPNNPLRADRLDTAMNNLSILLNGFMLDDQGHPTETHPLKALFTRENSFSCAVSNPDVSQRLKDTLKNLSIGLGTFMRPPRGEISKFLAPGKATLSSDNLDGVYNPSLRATVRAADPAITGLFLSSISYGNDVVLREPSMQFSSRQTAERVASSSPTGSASLLRDRSSHAPSHPRRGTGLPRDSILELLWESASEARPTSTLGVVPESSKKSGVSEASTPVDDPFASFLNEDVAPAT